MDWMTKEQRSRNMAAIRSKGNRSTEVSLRLRLVRAGVRGWRTHAGDIEGRPDFVFDGLGLVIFVDGCYWHGCPKCYRLPKQNRGYWQQKLGRNKARDKLVNSRLRKQGWSVIRIWEHTLKQKPATALARIVRKINELGGSASQRTH
jgi:DNA mismatch endonuclease (patch repair protein)